MNQVLTEHKVPEDVAVKIYELLHALRMRDILYDVRFGWTLMCIQMTNDRRHTVRNYCEVGWNTIPTYYDAAQNKILGHNRARRL